jgi:GAF domain-containing protein
MSIKPPVSANEEARLKALQDYHIMDTAPERSFDAITELASFICEVPIATIALVDDRRQWFKSKVGVEGSEDPREVSFCAHTMYQTSLMVVEDARTDERFASNPLVTGNPHIRFYAGAPLISPGGYGLGSLCIIDRTPRKLSPERGAALEKLATVVVSQLELRRVSHDLAQAATRIKTLSGLLPICSHCKAVRNDQNYWQSVDMYVKTHTDATVSHGVCPDCAKKFYPALYEELEKRRQAKNAT